VADRKRVGAEAQAGCPVFLRKGLPHVRIREIICAPLEKTAEKAGGDFCGHDLNRRCVSAERLDTTYGRLMGRHGRQVGNLSYAKGQVENLPHGCSKKPLPNSRGSMRVIVINRLLANNQPI
jgi:hypothetical protein